MRHVRLLKKQKVEAEKPLMKGSGNITFYLISLSEIFALRVEK